MIILLAGLLLWTAGHFWKRLLPAKHASMGDKAKGVSAIVSILGIILMVLGYRATSGDALWAVAAGMKPLNNILVVFAIYFMSPGPSKGAIFHKMRHPMLTGLLIWAVAHILVNPDLESLVLFGGLSIYTLIQMQLINRAEPEWTPNPKGTIAKDGMFLGAALVLTLVIGFIHGLIGPSPFGM